MSAAALCRRGRTAVEERAECLPHKTKQCTAINPDDQACSELRLAHSLLCAKHHWCHGTAPRLPPLFDERGRSVEERVFHRRQEAIVNGRRYELVPEPCVATVPSADGLTTVPCGNLVVCRPYCPAHCLALLGVLPDVQALGNRFALGLFAVDVRLAAGAVVHEPGSAFLVASRQVGARTVDDMERISCAALHQRYGKGDVVGPYAFSCDDDGFVLDALGKRCLMAYANTAPAANCELVNHSGSRRPTVAMEARVPLVNGAAVLVDYGEHYRNQLVHDAVPAVAVDPPFPQYFDHLDSLWDWDWPSPPSAPAPSAPAAEERRGGLDHPASVHPRLAALLRGMSPAAETARRALQSQSILTGPARALLRFWSQPGSASAASTAGLVVDRSVGAALTALYPGCLERAEAIFAALAVQMPLDGSAAWAGSAPYFTGPLGNGTGGSGHVQAIDPAAVLLVVTQTPDNELWASPPREGAPRGLRSAVVLLLQAVSTALHQLTDPEGAWSVNHCRFGGAVVSVLFQARSHPDVVCAPNAPTMEAFRQGQWPRHVSFVFQGTRLLVNCAALLFRALQGDGYAGEGHGLARALMKEMMTGLSRPMLVSHPCGSALALAGRGASLVALDGLHACLNPDHLRTGPSPADVLTLMAQVEWNVGVG